jgi:hypothetical protein
MWSSVLLVASGFQPAGDQIWKLFQLPKFAYALLVHVDQDTLLYLVPAINQQADHQGQVPFFNQSGGCAIIRQDRTPPPLNR